MKKFFSLVLALVMALSLTTVAWGAGVDCSAGCTSADTHVAAIGNTHYTSLEEAVADVAKYDVAGGTALGAATEIKLLKSTNAGLDIGNSSGTAAQNIILNLNGKTLTLSPAVGSTGTVTNGIRVLAYSKLEINGNGTVKCSDEVDSNGNYIKVGIANYGTLVLDDVDVLSGDYTLYTINNRGALTLDGTTYVENGQAGDKLAITNDPYNAYYDDFDASLTINSPYVEVGTVQVELYGNSVNDGTVVLNISNGYVDKIIDDGNTAIVAEGNITGGTFGTAPSEDYLAPGLELTQKADGTYTTNATSTGSSTAGVYDLHQADVKGTEIAGDIGYVTVPAVVEALGNGWLEYIRMDGKLFVKIDAADATTADFYVTKANEKTPLFYLSQIDSPDDVQYTYVVEEFTNIGVKCDQLNVPYTFTVADLDYYVWTNPVTGDKIYFVEFDEDFFDDGGYVAGQPYFNGAIYAGTINLLAGDEVVVALMFVDAVSGDPADPLNQHVFSPVAYDKTVPTKALCGLCGAQAVVYKDNKAPAGSDVIDVIFGTTPYDLVITSAGGAVSTPSTDKVTSAETFDAGIAMYVGMSVMAAAGSAVVIGKKKD